MNKSSEIYRLPLGLLGVFCCILGTRILLRIGSHEPLQEAPVIEQIELQTEELLNHSDPWDAQSVHFPKTDNDIPFPLPSQLDNLLNRNRSLQ